MPPPSCETNGYLSTLKMADTGRKAKVLLIGAGSIGTMNAYALEAGGKAEVTAVLRSNYQHVKEHGFTIDSVDHGKGISGWRPSHIIDTVPDVYAGDLDPYEDPYDYLILATKNTPDVGLSLVELIAPAVTDRHTTIVLMQNGLNIEKPFEEIFPHNVILSGIVLMGATETSLGVIKHDEPDVCKIGCFDPRDPAVDRAKKFIDLYNACGKVDCQYDPDVKYSRWQKLVYNSAYNTVSAILQMDVTRMRVYEHIVDDLVLPIMLEIMSIAKAAGVELPEDLPMKYITVDSLESWFMPSMGQDAVKGQFMEYENIAGEPIREAQRLGVACPTLSTVYHLLRALQVTTKEKRGLVTPGIEDVKKYRGSQ